MAWGIVILAMASGGGKFSFFLNLPSYLVCLFVGVGLTAQARGGRATVRAVVAWTTLITGPPRWSTTEDGHTLQTMGRSFWFAGWLGTGIGLMQILHSVDPGKLLHGASYDAFALSFVTLMYGAGLRWMVCEPAAAGILRTQPDKPTVLRDDNAALVIGALALMALPIAMGVAVVSQKEKLDKEARQVELSQQEKEVEPEPQPQPMGAPLLKSGGRFQLAPIVVNIGLPKTQGGGYFKIGVALAIRNLDQLTEEQILFHAPMMRDGVIAIVRRKSVTELLSDSGREALKEEITRLLDQRLKHSPELRGGEMSAVYFTEYIFQPG
ncbi:flagellar basal body-associated FliL family protein [Magnetofaba australis]|uniref:Flagellar protein FliL n=1 Tax=Magnetofaba australis IT-1 TaxID=1434232 RepID=A0A1Y2K046_9PROT|nr:flagellar basal body-associated FliL family protein [Magnetofaba australis]OSM01401.1 putative Flagellar biosynthesis protein FliL [Magnetofaba australis IT-1]